MVEILLENVEDRLSHPKYLPGTAGRRPLFAGIVDKTVKCWDAATGRLLWSSAEGRARRHGLMFVERAQGSASLVARTGKGLQMWDALVGKELVSPIPGGMATSSWGGRLLSLGQGDLPNGEVVIVAAGYFGEVLRWDADGNPFGEPLRGHHSPVLAVEVQKGAEGRTVIISISDDEIVRYWDLESGRRLGEPFDIGMAADQIAFGTLPDGRKVLATCEEGGTIVVWDVRAGRGAGPVRVVDCDVVVNGLSFEVVNGETRLIVSPYPGSVQHWNPITGEYLGESPGRDFFATDSRRGDRLAGIRLAGSRIHIGPAESVLGREVPGTTPAVRLNR